MYIFRQSLTRGYFGKLKIYQGGPIGEFLFSYIQKSFITGIRLEWSRLQGLDLAKIPFRKANLKYVFRIES